MRITAITPMKNEGPYILEWVAYHRGIGINDIHIFTNDCEDGTELICERLDELGLVTHRPNPSILVPDARHHIELIQYANHMPRLRRSDWVTFLDADEFVRVKLGTGHLNDLFGALPDVDAISLSLHSFGSHGRDAIGEGLMTEGFTRRRAYEAGPMPLKYLARGAYPWARLANNCPQLAPEDAARPHWVNGSGAPVDPDLRVTGLKAFEHPHNGVELVDVAHYAVRSARAFLVQKDRGSANPKASQGEALRVRAARLYWRKFDRNEVEDDLLARRAPAVAADMSALLDDAELRALHTRALAWHRDRAEALLRIADYQKLYKHIRNDHARAMRAVAAEA